MPPLRHQQTAWESRSHQHQASSGSSSATNTNIAASSSSTSATLKSSTSSKVPNHRWNNFVRFESRTSLSAPTAPEAVPPPPCTNAYRGGARHHHHNNNQQQPPSQQDSKDTSLSDTPTVKSVCNIAVSMKDAGLSTVDISRLISSIEDQLFARESRDLPDTVYFVSLDVSGNNLTCEAIQQISVSCSYN